MTINYSYFLVNGHPKKRSTNSEKTNNLPVVNLYFQDEDFKQESISFKTKEQKHDHHLLNSSSTRVVVILAAAAPAAVVVAALIKQYV